MFISDKSSKIYAYPGRPRIKITSFITAALVLWMLSTKIIVEPTPRPEFTRELQTLRPMILQAAHRHNVAPISKMSDSDFAVVITLILYNEDLGSLEEKVSLLRATTLVRQEVEIILNEFLGSNFSIRPSNIRPSVAYEMFQHQLPVPSPQNTITIPILIFGSSLNSQANIPQRDLYAAITRELAQPNKAVEYLAANLERGMYRAQYEGVSANWEALMAWHIRGIVSPRDIRNNRDAYNYTQRILYLVYACELIYPDIRQSNSQICRFMNQQNNFAIDNRTEIRSKT